MKTGSSSATEFESRFRQALDFYFDKKYQEALDIFTSLEHFQELNDSQRADVIRRIADCRSYIDPDQNLINAYDQAINLAGKSTHQVLWILASKANTLAILHRYAESLQNYERAIELADDPEDLEHLKWCVDEVISQREHFIRYGETDSWKKQILKDLTEKQKEIEIEEFWKAAEGKTIFKV